MPPHTVAMDRPAPILDVRRLGRRYGALDAVRELSFSVAPGEILGVVGPNGAGKTSTLRCLAGILQPSGGAIRICGRDLSTEPVEAKRELAFRPDEPRLFEYLSVQEHLNFVARLYGVEDWEDKARGLLAELELTGREHARPPELSRGMKQKLAIACGLLHSPRLLLLDEPLTGLDPLGIHRMKATLRARTREGAALVLSSHLLPLVEELCDRILVIAQGRCVALGTLAEIRERLAEGQEDSLEQLFVRITSGVGA